MLSVQLRPLCLPNFRFPSKFRFSAAAVAVSVCSCAGMLRRGMALLPHWSSRIFSLELDQAPVYFSVREERPEAAVGFGIPVAAAEEEWDRCFSLLVCGSDRIRQARLYSELRGRLRRELPPECRLAPISSFLPAVRGSLLKGYFVRALSSEGSARTQQLLRDFLRHEPLSVCSYSVTEAGGRRRRRLWMQHLWSPEGHEPRSFYVLPSQAPDYHPSTLNIVNNDVFYTYREAYDVIKQSAEIMAEARCVLEQLPSRVEARSKADFPVIVVEGLDATGKTTLTESLREALGVAVLRSPPPCLSPWRAAFDGEPALLRRAFYALGNYVTAQHIAQRHAAPVILDRFWHSTAAYAMATAVGGPLSNLPAAGSEVYRWPSDLLQPSLVILLTLEPEERERRLRNRGQGKTQEEKELDQNRLFRLRVEEAYRRITGPECVAVDAGPPPDVVLQRVLRLIRSKCRL